MTEWFGCVGQLEGPDDHAAMHRLLINANAVADLITGDLESLVDEEPGMPSAIHVVLVQDSEATDMEYQLVTKGKDGQHTYSIPYNWLVDAYTNQLTGTWNLLTVLPTVLMSLHEQGEMLLPPWKIDTAEVPFDE
ncbi:hypothetical protein GB931_01495 [Modestobacter sp. I12A-02628]|uniref:Uncharacterized protein n=1 Tax=Goekera deserti TaxID=2497753 RepID=A0A7K3WIH6_9ACTN|nr:hypothetical protein [Goekera deserti]MPQ96616.1 hypothetical protein [Goekera deserti]NDI47072.1 hypothetical protein [Goekera deserti]NEL55530.1 hypothetical protein [Goekera deserti]